MKSISKSLTTICVATTLFTIGGLQLNNQSEVAHAAKYHKSIPAKLRGYWRGPKKSGTPIYNIGKSTVKFKFAFQDGYQYAYTKTYTKYLGHNKYRLKLYRPGQSKALSYNYFNLHYYSKHKMALGSMVFHK
ncbi:hypothetical protein OXT66_01085 [Lentilactobacillus senioris]|uniref:hypothetical protein n=1 Tax=Lentilactobacillus senioris TaxID=931534 RepID=UPI00227F7C83|nr:hypothetical protein [Lentilactobacillus senioris]MCY9806139.1 hypothetical protein [Lentilactobacillus senioris]